MVHFDLLQTVQKSNRRALWLGEARRHNILEAAEFVKRATDRRICSTIGIHVIACVSTGARDQMKQVDTIDTMRDVRK